MISPFELEMSFLKGQICENLRQTVHIMERIKINTNRTIENKQRMLDVLNKRKKFQESRLEDEKEVEKFKQEVKAMNKIIKQKKRIYRNHSFSIAAILSGIHLDAFKTIQNVL